MNSTELSTVTPIDLRLAEQETEFEVVAKISFMIELMITFIANYFEQSNLAMVFIFLTLTTLISTLKFIMVPDLKPELFFFDLKSYWILAI